MMPIIHILNGDSLYDRFPKCFIDEVLVARECLVDGPVASDNFDDLMASRAKFISSYPECSAEDYIEKSIPQFKRIKSLPSNSYVYLWFEEDLFCQVNMWFICSLLQIVNPKKILMVRPNKGNEFNFSGMSENELIYAYENAQNLTSEDISFLTQCWKCYQHNDFEEFSQLFNEIPQPIAFIKQAINAQLNRKRNKYGLGKPEKLLLKIMKSLYMKDNELNFGPIFQEFYTKSMEYSFGDLQVLRMYNTLKKRYFI